MGAETVYALQNLCNLVIKTSRIANLLSTSLSWDTKAANAVKGREACTERARENTLSTPCKYWDQYFDFTGFAQAY